VISDEGAHAPTPRCYIAVFRRQRPTEPSARSRSRLRERPWGASESAPQEAIQPAPRADSPGRAASGICPLVSGPMCGSVSSVTVAENARRGVARDSSGGTKALERESPQGAQPTGIPAGVEGTYILARNGRGRRRAPARPEWSVASDAEGGSGERAGRRDPPSNHSRRLVTQPTSWWTQKGRGRRPSPTRKHRRQERRSGGRGTSSGRGLSKSYAYGSVFSSLRTCVATVPIRTPSSAATS